MRMLPALKERYRFASYTYNLYNFSSLVKFPHPPGFTGQFCESDIDDCDPSRCLEGSTCVDLLNDFRCECATGFTGPLCSVDIDDCVHPDLCLNNGLCIDRVS